MTAIRNPQTDKIIAIECDDETCNVVAPDDDIIMKHLGLCNLGWHCLGGKHYCPEHNPTTIGE